MATETSGRAPLSALLAGVQPTTASYVQAARVLSSSPYPELRPVKAALLATFTSEPLKPYLIVEGAARGLALTPHFGPFNQLEQQLLDPASALYAFQPDVLVIAARLEELAPELVGRFLSMSATERGERIEAVGRRLADLVAAARRHTSAPILLFNFAAPASLQAGLADATLADSQAALLQRANEAAAAACRAVPSAFVFDYARLVAESGRRGWSDPKLAYLWRVPFSIQAQIETSRRLARFIRAALTPPSKCLVLDFDNTIWGGVLGEDGPGGIKLGEDYPGNVFKDFQRALLALADRGVLLAAASKNNEPEALDVLEKHPDCLLKRASFASFQVNWGDKAASLRAIAKELGIGLDSLAFFDDNPVEREWVRSQLPEVSVIEAPQSPMDFARALEESGAFDQLALSTEDLGRARLYEQESRRQDLAAAVSVDDFLKQLDMTVTIGAVDAESMTRVAQLLAKTNQFNLTTRRHTAADVAALLDKGAVALWARVKDRFGDNGLVGAAIAAPEADGRWVIDTFLLSCRVIGRRVETALLSALSEEVRGRGARALLGEYLPTAKNKPAADFYPKHGFTAEGERWARTEPVPPPVLLKIERQR